MKKIVLFFCLWTLISCVQETNFNNEELIWLDPYEKNDILIFQNSNTSKILSIKITDEKLYHKEYNPISSDLKEQIIRIYYKVNESNYEGQLLEMYKRPDEFATPIISFLKSSFFVNRNQLEFNKLALNSTDRSFEEVYKFHKEIDNHFSENRHKTLPQTLYWDKEFGIIKYVTYEGDIWELIEFKRNNKDILEFNTD
jgi:hypothetical protein